MYSDWTPDIALVSAGRPAAPMNVNITSVNAQEVVMVWDPPDDGGTYITSYECKGPLANNPAWERFPNFRSSCTMVNRPAGQGDYSVRAWNSVGVSTTVTLSVDVAAR
jgi:hypothetical protein